MRRLGSQLWDWLAKRILTWIKIQIWLQFMREEIIEKDLHCATKSVCVMNETSLSKLTLIMWFRYELLILSSWSGLSRDGKRNFGMEMLFEGNKFFYVSRPIFLVNTVLLGQRAGPSLVIHGMNGNFHLN